MIYRKLRLIYGMMTLAKNTGKGSTELHQFVLVPMEPRVRYEKFVAIMYVSAPFR